MIQFPGAIRMGLPAGKERVERLMRENGIRVKYKRRYKATTDSKHAMPIALDPLLFLSKRDAEGDLHDQCH